MKILIQNWRDIKNPEAGGAEVHLHEIFRRIASKGHEVVLLSSKFKGSKNTEVIDGIKVIRFGNKYIFNFIDFWYYLLKLRKENFDIVIDDISKIPLYTPLYIKKPLIAIIHHIHGETLFKELPFIIALFIYLSEKLITLFYKKTFFVTVSQSTQKELIQMGIPEKNTQVIYNATNYNSQVLRDKPKKPIVIYAGRVKKYKRLEHLITAFKIVKEKLSDTELIIAGKGDAYKELKELSEKLDLEDVKFYGEITESEKVEILQKGVVFVNPSMKEGWGLTAIEANACGTPCIAYDVPGLRDSIINGETGLLVKENGNIEKLAEAIIKILENKEFREKLSKNALQYSKKFSWNKSAEDFLKIIKAIIKMPSNIYKNRRERRILLKS